MTITAVFNKLFNLDEGCLFYRFNNADGKIWIMPAKKPSHSNGTISAKRLEGEMDEKRISYAAQDTDGEESDSYGENQMQI